MFNDFFSKFTSSPKNKKEEDITPLTKDQKV